MRKYIPLFLDILIKFRVMTVPQLRSFCGTSTDRRRLYDHLTDLKKWSFIARMTHETAPIIAYRSTPKLFREIFGSESGRNFAIRQVDLGHTLACTQAALSLMKYSYVSGLSLEHELSADDFRLFCRDRRPDGVVQITRPDKKYELAIEVEKSVKAPIRVDLILKSYQETFENKKYACSGVIIIATHKVAMNAYLEQLERMPSTFRDRVILKSSLELEDLSEKYFGQRLNHALDNLQFPYQKTRSMRAGVIQYLPINSTGAISPDRNKGYL